MFHCKHATWLPPFQCFQAFALAQSIKRRSKQWCHAVELRWETRQICWILLLTDHRTYRTVGIVQELSWEINTHDWFRWRGLSQEKLGSWEANWTDLISQGQDQQQVRGCRWIYTTAFWGYSFTLSKPRKYQRLYVIHIDYHWLD